MGSTLGIQYDLVLTLRSEIFECLRETLYRHALEDEHLQSARSEKKKTYFSSGSGLPLLRFLWACGRWGHAFATRASPRS